jgi:predicted negative regulator of RcsB-dependent stress response
MARPESDEELSEIKDDVRSFRSYARANVGWIFGALVIAAACLGAWMAWRA